MVEGLRHVRSWLRRFAALAPFLPRALGLVWQAAPRWSGAWIGLLVVQGLLPAATVFLTKALVDALVAAVGTGGDGTSLRPALVLALAMAGLLLLGELLSAVAAWVRTAQAELVRDHVGSLVHERSMAVDLSFYDEPDYFDRLHRARSEAGQRPVALVENLGGLLQNGITLAAMLAVLARYGAWLPAGLALGTLPALWVVLRFAARQHEFRLRTTADQRRTWYYEWLLTARETAAELRLFGLGDHFRGAWRDARRRLRTEQLSLARDQGGAELLAGLSGLVVMGASVLWMAGQALQGRVTLGDLALVLQAFNQGQRLTRTLLQNVGQIYGNSLFLEDLFEFLALEPRVADPADPVPLPGPERGVAIDFRGVAFRYPGSGRRALDGFDLSVPAGQVAAVVGPNGAGKSTLVKLLCRFYDPEEGTVGLNGVDLRSLALDDLRRRMTVLFQVPVKYNATVAENIAVGRPAATASEISAAARDAGAEDIVNRLPRGYDTLLGIWFAGGTDLSVGEWQRVALARAWLRDASVVVLDEPTSAMDPWAEADWLARFRRLAEGRTAVVITHRFTTARYADVIHVMDAGRIVESGSHDELLALNGRYARSWSEQMRQTMAPPPGTS